MLIDANKKYRQSVKYVYKHFGSAYFERSSRKSLDSQNGLNPHSNYVISRINNTTDNPSLA